MTTKAIVLPTPHKSKLTACLENQSLPPADKERLAVATEKYEEWIAAMAAVKPGDKKCVTKLVEATNKYKRYVELDLIFDSPGNFLYRQKGQLKLDNTILEEFLPHLFYRSLQGLKEVYEFGPSKTFAGLTMLSTMGNHGNGGLPKILTKDQDFVLGKRVYVRSSFDSQFASFDERDAHLGYVCAECKTNLDKTMFQEAVATSRDLKMAVPGSLYFLVCEFLDMTPRSVTATQIDDVLIVRKAKRLSSNKRQDFKTPEARAKHRSEQAAFVDSSRFCADVFQRMVDKVQKLVAASDPSVEAVLKQGHF